MNKKILSYISSLLLISTIVCTPTLAKYNSVNQNVLCDLILGEFTIVESKFIIDEETGDMSQILWGNGSSNGVTDDSNNLHSLEDKAFLVKNTTGKKMKISLEIDFYLSWLQF